MDSLMNQRRSRYIILLLVLLMLFFVILAAIVQPIVQEIRNEQVFESLQVVLDEDDAIEDPLEYVNQKARELQTFSGSYRFRLENRVTGDIYEASSRLPEEESLIPPLRVPHADAEHLSESYKFSLRLEGGLLSHWRLAFLFLFFFSAIFILIITLAIYPRSIKRYTRFITAVTEGMQQLAIGKEGEPLPMEDAELGDLARAYNHLRERLDKGVLEIQKANTLLNGILEAMRDGVLVINEEGRLLVWTERAMEFLGEDVSPSPAEKFQHSSQQDEAPLFAAIGSNAYMLSNLVSERFDTIAVGEAQTASIRLHWPRDMTLDLYLKAIFVAEKKHLLIVLHDKTRVVQLEGYRRDFVANITHELKTPLTSIRGYTELLLNADRSRETRLSFLQVIDEETRRLADLIQDLLLLAEIEGKDEVQVPVETYVLPILEDCFRSLQTHAKERGIRLDHRVSTNARVPLTREALRQVLTNLLSNAVRYIDNSGHVLVYMNYLPGEVQLIVEDDGPGIEPKHQQRIFERFYRVHKERSRELGGTGLGLSIVKNMVEAAGGRIELTEDPGPGIGCQFILKFPAAMEDTPHA